MVVMIDLLRTAYLSIAITLVIARNVVRSYP
jgi:hypothetical protein